MMMMMMTNLRTSVNTLMMMIKDKRVAAL